MEHRATYSPEDNKLRLYPAHRLSAEDYARIKAAGFKWAPKQEIFVAPMWTPHREDTLLEMCEDIDDEDYSPEERAADRAERFSGYRDKRAGEDNGTADRFESGPQVFGNQSQARAERQAAKHDRIRVRSVSQWSKAEYWQHRTEGVISHALHKSSAAVRRSRILKIEADQRKNAKELEEAGKRWDAWQKVLTLDGIDAPLAMKENSSFSGIDAEQCSLGGKLAYHLANTGFGLSEYLHPRTGRKSSLYSLLTDPQDPITPRDAALLWEADRDDPRDAGSYRSRWADHYANRLAYERAMLAEEGGSAGDADMIPGGFVGKCQIQGVNRSPVTGKVVSVKLWGEQDWYRGEPVLRPDGSYGAPLVLKSINIERFKEGIYRAPTPEELQEFKERTKEKKAQAKAAKKPEPALINPTLEDAQRLQTVWNDHARQRHEKAVKEGRLYSGYIPAEVRSMTQAEYSSASKGSYAHLETVPVCEHGREPKRQYGQNVDLTPIAFKIRKAYPRSQCTTTAYRVVVLTDKPQKPLPLDWEAIEQAALVH